MGTVIDFNAARIRLRSKVKDPVIIQDMLDNAYDPCDPEEVKAYWMREELVEALSEGIHGEFKQDYGEVHFVPLSELFISDDNK